MHIHFPIGTRPHLAQNKRGGHVPEMPPPLDPPMVKTALDLAKDRCKLFKREFLLADDSFEVKLC